MKKQFISVLSATLFFGASAFAQSAGNQIEAASAGNIMNDANLSSGNFTQYNRNVGNIIVGTGGGGTTTGGGNHGNKPVYVAVNEAQANSVVLEADVMINIEASSFTAIFAATEKGRTLVETDSLMGERVQRFINGMVKDGIQKDNIHVDFISCIPVYDVELVSKKFSNNADEIQSGFQMKKNIHVTFENHQNLDKIVSRAANSEIYDLVKVDYNIGDIQLAYDTLRAEAARVIGNKRTIYDKMGLETKIISLSEGSDVAYPIERYDGYVAYQTGLSYEEVKAQNPNVNIRKREKLETIFYNKIAYNQFDVVMNPNTGEPVVQFFYKLKVRYRVQPKPEAPVDASLEEMLGAN